MQASHVRNAAVSTASASGGSARSSSWSSSEDETLMRARAQGLNCNQISSKYFPNKSANACRKRHKRLIEKQFAERRDGEGLEDLAEAYMEVRSEMWRILSAKVNENWQLIEQKCMGKGLKNLVQAHRQAQRKRGIYEVHQHDSGVGISDLDEPYNDDSPIARAGGSELPLVYQHQSMPFAHAQMRIPSIHSILQDPTSMLLQQASQGFTDLPISSETSDICPELSGITNSRRRTYPPESHDSPLLLENAFDTDDVSTSSIFSDSSVQLDDDEFNLRKDILLDHLMLRFHDIFEDPGTPYRHRPSSSTSPKGSASNSCTLSKATNFGQTYKHRRSTGRDQDDEERGEPPNKRPKKSDESGTCFKNETKSHFACPFFKHDPTKHYRAKPCSGPVGWENTARLKEHLYRRHILAPRCARCSMLFECENELNEHQREPDGCSLNPQEPREGLTKRQIERLKKRSIMFQAGSEEEKWKIIYLICFPDTAPGAMPTPYYDYEATRETIREQSPKDQTLAQYEAYMNRELPRKVRKELEIAIGKIFGPIEETLKNQLEGLIRNCQERLSRDYGESKGSTESISADVISGNADPGEAHSLTAVSSTVTPASAMAPYVVPMDSTEDPWQGMDASSTLNNCTWSDSAYVSDSNYPLPSDPWWPPFVDTAQFMIGPDPFQMDNPNTREPVSSIDKNASCASYVKEEKGRVDGIRDG